MLTKRLTLPAKHPASEMGSTPAWAAADTHPTAVGPIETAQPIKIFCQYNTDIKHGHVIFTCGIASTTAIEFHTGGGSISGGSESSEDGDNRELHFERCN